MAKAKTMILGKLSKASVERVAAVWISGEVAGAQRGGLLAKAIAKEANAVMSKDDAVDEKDAKAIVNTVGAARGWGKQTCDGKVSHCKAFMQVRGKLPGVIDALIKTHNACSWNDAYQAALALIAGKDPEEKVAAMREKAAESKDSNGQPKDAKAAKAKLTKSLEKALEWDELPSSLKAKVRALMKEIG